VGIGQPKVLILYVHEDSFGLRIYKSPKNLNPVICSYDTIINQFPFKYENNANKTLEFSL